MRAWSAGLPGLRRLPTCYHLTAVDDIGARALADPELSFVQPRGDLLTPVEIAGLMGLEYEQFQVDDPELRKVFTSDAEPDVDIEALRALHPGLRTFAEFMEDTERRADRRVHGG